MEKLVKLLNEYVWQDSYWIDEFDNGVFITWWDGDQCFIDEHIISKNFWFIEWLVENDKIDVESYCRITSVERKWEKDVYRDEVDSLIMLLAIQDSPIEFLCSIIK